MFHMEHFCEICESIESKERKEEFTRLHWNNYYWT